MQAKKKGDLVFGMTWLTFVAAGAAVGYGIDANTGESIEQHQSELANIQEQQLDLDHERDTIEADLGENCMRLVTVYLPGGELEERDEDTVVDDLLREPGLPCGESATEIRTEVSKLRAIEAELEESQAQSDDLKDGDDADVDSSDPFFIILGALGGGLLGLFPAGLAQITVEDRSKNK